MSKPLSEYSRNYLPGAMTMTTLTKAFAVLGLLVTASTMLEAQRPGSPPFKVEVRDVRTIAQSSGRGVALTLRFISQTQRPLSLAAEHQTLVLTDDRGNRYDDGVHGFGIGMIAPPTIDSKFTIAPGSFADAFLIFAWPGAQGKFFGLQYALNMTVREVERFPGGQSRLSQSWPIRFSGLTDGGSVPAAGATSLTADACAGRLDCSAAHGLIAEVVRVSTSLQGNTPQTRFGVRFRNTSSSPMILCLTSRSERGADDRGNTYVLTDEPRRVQGIGICDTQGVDVSFSIAPGGSREAMLEYAYWGDRNAQRGTKADFSFAVQQLQLLPGDQARRLREVHVLFRDLAVIPGASTVASGGAGAGAGGITTSAGADACSGIANCYAAGPFTVQLTSMVVSKITNERRVRVALRLRNLTAQPLILCFTSASGVANDERQNRYSIRENDGMVKGIGLCRGQTANTGFVVAPGGSRDASLEFHTGIYDGTVLGDVFSISFALGQLNILPGDQIQNVGQYVASFEGVTESGGRSTTSGVVAPRVPASGTTNPAGADPCAKIANCYAADPFTVQLTSVVVSKDIHERQLRVAMRFRNLTAEPLILCFTSASGVANDDRQNRYSIRENNGLVKGIGICRKQTANTSFVVAAGGTRDASLEFHTFHQNGTLPLGDVFSISFGLDQLNILPGNQVQQVGQYVANFEGVKASGATLEKAAGLLDMLRKATKK